MNLKSVSRLVTAGTFIGIGILHFVRPKPFLKIMPPALPWKRELVFLSGAAEIAGGLGLLGHV